MRLGAALVATLMVAAVRPAAAQPAPEPAPEPAPQPPTADPDALVAEGEALARTGEYTRAIEAFKRADGIVQRARHACLIGLVYTRREVWSQAELFFARCRERAIAADPVPDWLPEAERQLAAKLAEVAAAPVDVRVEPAGVAVKLVLAPFPDDESFTPRVIHLAPGTHTITATADGYEPAQERIEITGKDPVTVTITLRKPGETVPDRPPPPPPKKRRNIAKWLWIGAGGVAAIGVGFHVLASREREYLSDALTDNDPMRYDQHESAFDTYRAVTFACYGAAVTAAAVGAVLHFTRDKEESGPMIGGAIDGDAGFVTIRWRR
jgi:hypothetical protein